MRSFATAATDVHTDITALDRATTEVHASCTLALVTRLTLKIGNFLNAGSGHARVAAFQFDALLKLKEVKATGSMPGCRTLLHFLARQLLIQVRTPENPAIVLSPGILTRSHSVRVLCSVFLQIS